MSSSPSSPPPPSPPHPPLPPPPPLPRLDDRIAADLARKRLAPKFRFPFSISLPNIRQSPSQHNDDRIGVVEPAPSSPAIKLNAPHIADDDEYKDKYEWAVLYENQRGYLYSTSTVSLSHPSLQVDYILYTLLL